MFNADENMKKWAPILEHSELPGIGDNYRKAITATLLENQEKAMAQERAQYGFLNETAANDAGALPDTGGGVAKWDPVMISLVRRAMPNLMAYDVAGVQPMAVLLVLSLLLRAVMVLKVVLKLSSTKQILISLVLVHTAAILHLLVLLVLVVLVLMSIVIV